MPAGPKPKRERSRTPNGRSQDGEEVPDVRPRFDQNANYVKSMEGKLACMQYLNKGSCPNDKDCKYAHVKKEVYDRAKEAAAKDYLQYGKKYWRKKK